MVERQLEKEALLILTQFPCLGIVGPRQCGKTTLARYIEKKMDRQAIYLDMELPSDLQKLSDAETFLKSVEDSLVIIDEVQRTPHLFPILRALIDQKRTPGRFLLLGSASPELIRDSSESLAGRIAYLEMSGLNSLELGKLVSIDQHWLLGGFPDAVLNPASSNVWMKNFIATYIERDLPLLGLDADPILIRRLWTMVAHQHGQLLQWANLAKSLEIDTRTLKRYLLFLEEAYLIRFLQPFHSNLKKRLVKSPKVYIRDSGILHYLLGIKTLQDLHGHPQMGNSWEGYVIEQLSQQLDDDYNLFFYRTHTGAEIDLVLERNGTVESVVEIKYGDSAQPTRGNTEAAETLEVKRRFLLKANGDTYPTSNNFQVISLFDFLTGVLKK
ncbi:MAG: ATP-binding protein [Luteibaculum sp.]